ncbi:CRTAC1 family protein [Draconibacterium halophilum]|uniref:Tetratricopeptide repeat protein n=1 Tax=Draconibacterium halophilum TaxID=2706887 RepID=A0A6C0RCB1_9BACT|nr:CRTAC1 family protein [Draconibacterium halophilum]QIA07707.1 tetratricopeptide repeat protein [Draconibacterium halophilum]
MMKNNSVFLVIILLLLVLSACEQGKKKTPEQEAIELMTAQTMGIAYLEEFKLEEAEAEFLKYIDLSPDDKLGYANLGLTYLRMGKYQEAEEQIQKAIKIDEQDADIRLILATIYEMDNKREKAISVLNEALTFAPDHAKILYDLSELYSVANDEESNTAKKECIQKLVDVVPQNLVPQLSLINIYINANKGDSALARLELIAKQFPAFPKEAITYYEKTLDLLRKNDLEKATTQFTIFHNYMKVTAPYQAGIMELKGPGGNLIGFPLIEYNKDLIIQDVEEKSYLDVIKFSEVSASAGLNNLETIAANGKVGKSYLVSADYDGDGDIDIYVENFDQETNTSNQYLFSNNMGRYTDVASEVGIKHQEAAQAVGFVDYENDGFLDLFITTKDGDLLYRNAGKDEFVANTTDAGLENKSAGRNILFFDYDHDGDLDILKATDNGPLMFRNNSDGTFTEKIAQTGIDKKQVIYDAAFGDFDEDDDIDLIVTGPSGTVLYANQRQGVFMNVNSESALEEHFAGQSVEVGDFNNDGFLDVLLTSSETGELRIFENHGNSRFSKLENVDKMFASTANTQMEDAKLFDFDNDGYLDLILAGTPVNEGERGVFLYHNDAPGKFSDVSNLLPENVLSASQIDLFDYNEDGDIDVLLARANGGVYLLRNDGGNINHYVNMKLVGLRTGSAKNNHFGIGAKIEVRSGDLYQTKVIDKPGVHFGLGHRKNADIIRITWTNGVPQNIFRPGVDQALIEAQTLKGSCPFLYTWNGNKYEFVKDITWRSALGMPLGIMGENTAYGFAAASDDYIKIPATALQAKDGKYLMQVTSELWETIYMDKIRLAVADHPASVEVFVPEQFTPPPFPGYDLHQVRQKIVPVSAVDHNNHNVLSCIEKEDDVYLSGFDAAKYQGTTEMHTLTIDPGSETDTEHLKLYMKGWVFPTDASINSALSQTSTLNSMWPVIQVVNKKGEWENAVENFGFPMGKDKTVIVDLSGKFKTNDHRVRLVTNMEIYWDYIFFSNVPEEVSVKTTFLDPEAADFHYRGFSRMYRKGGRYGPHWFDYYDVDKNPQWVDLVGNYTRYGDVLPLLLQSDDQYIISNAGDEISISFSTTSLPELPDGWKRSFFIHSVGWVKDGDLNTAFGNQVEPLPFHGMKTYPPSENDKYPMDAAHRKYLEKYNTRKVTIEGYRNFVRNQAYNDEKN